MKEYTLPSFMIKHSAETVVMKSFPELEAGEKMSHYTSVANAVSIINSNQFWATNFRDMNDPSEFTYGYSVFSESFEGLFGKIAGYIASERVSDFRAGLANLKDFIEEDLKNPRMNLYFISFTPHYDRLSQWRGYGDHGSGVSLEVAPDSLSPITNADKSISAGWVKVIYNKEEQQNIVNEVMKDWVQEIKHKHGKGKNISSDAAFKSYLLELYEAIYFNSLRFKHPSWEEESEYRFCIFKEAANEKCPTHIRGSASKAIQYLKTIEAEVSNKEKPLFSSICLGAKVTDKDRQRNIFMDLIKCGEEKVTSSGIPWV